MNRRLWKVKMSYLEVTFCMELIFSRHFHMMDYTKASFKRNSLQKHRRRIFRQFEFLSRFLNWKISCRETTSLAKSKVCVCLERPLVRVQRRIQGDKSGHGPHLVWQ